MICELSNTSYLKKNSHFLQREDGTQLWALFSRYLQNNLLLQNVFLVNTPIRGFNYEGEWR